jgi:DNA-binding beta-propeller fold protein YncE
MPNLNKNINTKAIFKRFVLPVLIVILFTGCSSERGRLFGDLDAEIVWPEPPEVARVKYIGQLSSELDLKREVSFDKALQHFIFGKPNIGAMLSPKAVVFDQMQRVFVADNSGGVIHMMDMKNRRYKQFSKLADGKSLRSPVALSLIESDIYVVDSILASICVFTSTGTFKFSFGSDILQRPSGIAYSQIGQKIYVSDTKQHAVYIFDTDGKYIKKIGERGIGRGKFNFPTCLWADKAGKLYVSDTLNYRVQIFARDGSFIFEIGKHGNRPGYFAHPSGLATDSFGNIYVADRQFENIQIFDSKGRILLAIGGEGRGPGQFWLPSGIFIDDTNRIFIADSFNSRIQIFQLLEVKKP